MFYNQKNKVVMKYINLVLGTILSWFDNKAFSFVFAFILAVVAFFCADPVDGVAIANVAVFALLVAVLTTAVLLFGSSIVMKKGYNLAAAGCGLVGSVLGVLVALICNSF